jgi:hypothetical protein
MAISSGLGSSALLPAGLGFRNVLVNGDFKVWQRGTSLASGGATTYTADRWIVSSPNAGRTASRQSAGLDGFQYCMRVSRDSGNSTLGALDLSQSVETINSYQFAGKQITLSFWARAGANYSPASSGLYIGLQSGTGTDQNIESSWTGGVSLVNTTITLTTSWQKFQFTSPVASSATGIGLYIRSTPVGTAGADDYFEITGVQLEQNYQPTPFEQRPYGVELQLCQRYYYRLGNTSVSGAYLVPSNNIVYSASAVEGCLQHPVPMRTSAVTLGSNSVYAYNVYQGNWVGIPRAAVSSSNSTTHAVIITDRSGGTSWSTFVTGTTQMAFALVANTSAGYIEVSAEL